MLTHTHYHYHHQRPSTMPTEALIVNYATVLNAISDHWHWQKQHHFFKDQKPFTTQRLSLAMQCSTANVGFTGHIYKTTNSLKAFILLSRLLSACYCSTTSKGYLHSIYVRVGGHRRRVTPALIHWSLTGWCTPVMAGRPFIFFFLMGTPKGYSSFNIRPRPGHTISNSHTISMT